MYEIDENYVEFKVAQAKILIQYLEKKVSALKDENTSNFQKLMAYNYLNALISSSDAIHEIVKESFKNGFYLNSDFFEQNEKEEKGWSDKYLQELSMHPLFKEVATNPPYKT